MLGIDSAGTACQRVATVETAVGRDRRGLVRAGLAAVAALSLAVVGGLSLAAADAGATTFPGTNGRLAASGPLTALPAPPQDELASQLELFTMDPTFVASTANDPDMCQLTHNENSDFNPRFSKDGKKVVYVKDNNLWTLALDPASGYECEVPESEKLLTVSASDSFVGGWCQYPSSHPTKANQEWVVFQRNTVALSFEVYRVRVDANRMPVPGTEENLTLNAANDSQPAVTPDCEKIAFHSNRSVTPAPPSGSSLSNIWVMGFDGDSPTTSSDDPTNLTGSRTRADGTASEESAPSWSPDKTKIAFQTDSDTVSGQPRNMEIYRMNANGTSVTRLTTSPSNADSTESGFDVTGFDLIPSYSPDGTKICFHSGRALDDRDPAWRNSGQAGVLGQWEIYTMSSGGASVERKTKRKGNDERCGWQETP